MATPQPPRSETDPNSFWHWINVNLRRRSTGDASVETGNTPIPDGQLHFKDKMRLVFKSREVTTDQTPHASVVHRDADSLDNSAHSVPTVPGTSTATASNQQPSPFSSSAFRRLPTPLPVEDVFFSPWPLSAIRVMVRSLVIYLSISWTLNWFGFFIVVINFFVCNALIKAGRTSLFNFPLPTNSQLFWALLSWIQKLWEHLASRAFFSRPSNTFLHRTWWFIYLLTSDMDDFRQNYIEAWRQKQHLSIHIYVDDEHLELPIPLDHNDKVVLEHIRMFYRMIIVGRGIPALLLPKQLEKIDVVEMTIDTYVLGCRIESLQLGRYKGRLIESFKNPGHVEEKHAIADKIHHLSNDTALEFKQTYNLTILATVLAIPPLASIIFVIVWIRVFFHEFQGADKQVLVSTAFTVASYIVTAGALVIAFVAFLEQKRSQNDEMLEKASRRSVESGGEIVTTMRIPSFRPRTQSMHARIPRGGP